MKASQAFTAAVHGIMERPAFARARFGFDARDVGSGAPIFQHNAYDIFPGASTTKILTAAYALALLGPDFRFRTKLVRTGRVDESGTLHGDLVLIASGDPNLSNRVTSNDTLEFESSEPLARLTRRDPLQVIDALAGGARDAGIRRITGTVLVDLHLFAEDYREAGTGACVSPVSINDNVIDFEVVGGVDPGDPITYQLSPPSGYVRFTNRAITGERASEPRLQFSKEHREADGTWSVVISGSVPAGSTSRAALAVESPGRFARTLLVEALANVGVVVEGGLFGEGLAPAPTPTDAMVVAEHVSPPLAEATKIVLKVSQNLHTEMLIPLIGATVRGARGDEARAAGYACCAELSTRWELDATGFFQGDACGVYGYFSPEFMSRVLVRIAATDIYEPFLLGLPVMGRDGTLWYVEPESPAAGHVMAKPGTLCFGDQLRENTQLIHKGLAGYVTTQSGRRIAFAIYLNNFLCARSPEVQPTRVAGQVLGELASAIHEHL